MPAEPAPHCRSHASGRRAARRARPGAAARLARRSRSAGRAARARPRVPRRSHPAAAGGPRGVEQHPLAHADRAEERQLPERARHEARTPRRPRDGHARETRTPDLGGQRGPIERREPDAPPPPAREREPEEEHHEARPPSETTASAASPTPAPPTQSAVARGPFESASPAQSAPASRCDAGGSRAPARRARTVVLRSSLMARRACGARRAWPDRSRGSRRARRRSGTAPCCGPVVDDPLRSHGADAGERVELPDRRRRSDGPAQPGPPAPLPERRPTRPRRAPARAPARRPRAVPRG